MYPPFFLAIIAIGFLELYRTFRFNQYNNDIGFSSSSSSTSSSSSSSTSLSYTKLPSLSCNWIHDVFWSFRGEDVRREFLSHIRKGFEREGIKQFKDDEMERGEFISFQLKNAIRRSKIKNIKELYTRPNVEFMSVLTNQNDGQALNLEVEREKLGQKKVLVIIDNVDGSVKLDDALKQTKWFGPGSRIILAVQDRKLLEEYKIDSIYNVALPSDSQALQIFCMAAFGQMFPGFEDLASKTLDIAGKLPESLKIMGSHFKGKSREEWIDIIHPIW